MKDENPNEKELYYCLDCNPPHFHSMSDGCRTVDDMGISHVPASYVKGEMPTTQAMEESEQYETSEQEKEENEY